MRGSAFVVTLFLLLASPQDGTAEPIDADAIDAIFAVHDRADGPGCAVAVYRTGEPMLAKVYGLANLEHGVPITPRTAFDVGSISKQFTALAVLMLEAEGALSLDDDVRRFVPELPDDGAPLTLRDLLHHTSGLRGYPALEQLSGRRVETQEQLVELLARQRELNFPPGSRHEYSHSDYELLAVVVERALGEPFGEVLERTVLGPLGMKNSHVLDSRRLPLPRRATAYAPADSGWATLFPTSLLVGGTGLYTTLEDLERWDRNFYDARVGGRKLVDRLLERPQLASGDPIPYAYGLRHEEYRGLPVVHRGGGGGFSTELMRFPTQGLTVATLCNDDGAHPLHLSRAVAEIFLGDDMEGAATAPSVPEAVSPPAGEPERYAGTYRTEGLRWSLLDLAAAEGALWEVFPDHRQRLDRLADGRYHA
ncbi:MAG TPA: serine hydrolase domain-containing protein, partial [Thermoanaerobaculia bacterium]|nr:serine hydrolase domain-containing protein [Thermoanaerobaculia bacterium]